MEILRLRKSLANQLCSNRLSIFQDNATTCKISPLRDHPISNVRDHAIS